jgi:hypothetical protein
MIPIDTWQTNKYLLFAQRKCSVFEHMHSKLAKFYGGSKFLEIVLIDMRSVRQYLAVVFRKKTLGRENYANFEFFGFCTFLLVFCL